MVQLQPSLMLNLKNLASHGAVISAEQQVRSKHTGAGSIIKGDKVGAANKALQRKLTRFIFGKILFVCAGCS